MNQEEYLKQVAATRPERIRWWHEARFGMFVHWGPWLSFRYLGSDEAD